MRLILYIMFLYNTYSLINKHLLRNVDPLKMREYLKNKLPFFLLEPTNFIKQAVNKQMADVPQNSRMPIVETKPVQAATCPTSLGSATNSYIEISVFSVNK